MSRSLFCAALFATMLSSQGETRGLRDDALREALDDDAHELWVYDDLDRAKKRARESGQPLLVTFRCVP